MAEKETTRALMDRFAVEYAGIYIVSGLMKATGVLGMVLAILGAIYLILEIDPITQRLMIAGVCLAVEMAFIALIAAAELMRAAANSAVYLRSILERVSKLPQPAEGQISPADGAGSSL